MFHVKHFNGCVQIRPAADFVFAVLRGELHCFVWNICSRNNLGGIDRIRQKFLESVYNRFVF